MAVSRIGDFVGRVLGDRYRLLAPVGTGGSAHVFLAEDVKLRRRVAVKVLHAALADDEAFLKRFRLEAQAVAGLNHPHIMRVYDWGDDAGVDVPGPFLVLEYLGGGSLRDMLDTGYRLSPAQALLVGLEAARGLDHAHRRGLVHRDIKPANLLFDEEGRLCVADFGVARALAEAAWTEPTGAVIGTARYASPEQARGASVDGRADVYALALVLVEALTGQVPFATDTTIATLMARADRPLVAPPEAGPLTDAINAAGTIDVNDRVDAAGFIRALDKAARNLDAPAPLPLAHLRRDDDVTQVIDRDPTIVAPVVDARPTAAVTTAAAAAPRRRRWPWVVLAIVLLAVLGAGAAYAATTVFVPSHPVPNLKDRQLADARRLVAADHFKLHVTRQPNETVPADQVLSQDPQPATSLKEKHTVNVTVSSGPPPRPVPDLTGLDEARATAALTAAGFKIGTINRPYDATVAKGQVMSWTHKGEQLAKGAGVDLTISNGPQPVTLSDWKGKPFADAKKAMESVGLKVQPQNVYSDQFPQPGTVVATNPGPGDVQPGTTVVVSVSQGPQTVSVPDVTGKSVEDATSILSAAGLNVAGVAGNPNKKVVFTDPPPNAKVQRGTGVTLYTKL